MRGSVLARPLVGNYRQSAPGLESSKKLAPLSPPGCNHPAPRWGQRVFEGTHTVGESPGTSKTDLRPSAREVQRTIDIPGFHYGRNGTRRHACNSPVSNKCNLCSSATFRREQGAETLWLISRSPFRDRRPFLLRTQASS